MLSAIRGTGKVSGFRGQACKHIYIYICIYIYMYIYIYICLCVCASVWGCNVMSTGRSLSYEKALLWCWKTGASVVVGGAVAGFLMRYVSAS